MLPTLSIISPYNGTSDLMQFVECLSRQELSANLFEVIICSTIVLPHNFHLPSNVTFLTFPSRIRRSEKHTAGILRNYAALFARGHRLVFLDSDSIPSPELLTKHWLFDRKYPHAALCGAWRDIPSDRWESVRSEISLASFKRLEPLATNDPRGRHSNREAFSRASWHEFYSGNASVPASSFRAAGGFDEAGHRCHDMDLAYRLSAQGVGFFLDLTANALHPEHFRSVFYRIEQAQGWKLLGRKFPEIVSIMNRQQEITGECLTQVLNFCQSRFQTFCDQHLALVAGTYGHCSPLLAEAEILKYIDGHVSLVRQYDWGQCIHLRLHRDCWDFGIIRVSSRVLASPRFSVIIPFYNAALTIERTLGSILAQHCQDFEIIVVDDASDNDSSAVIAPYLSTGRVRLLRRRKNQGMSAALNTGLHHALGEYVVHIDADDWLHPEALLEIDLTLKANPIADGLYGSATSVNGGDFIPGREFFARNATDHFDNFQPLAPRVYSRLTLLKLGGWSCDDAFEGRYYEDRLMLKRISEKGSLARLQRQVYYAVEDCDSLSRSRPRRTAAAKLGILWHQATATQFQTPYYFSGRTLTANVSPIPQKPPTCRWSVIIPYCRNPELLQLCLQSWSESDLVLAEHEILVVSYGDNPQPAFLSFAGLNVRLIHTCSDRPGNARNEGVKQSCGEALFFCDADHVVPPQICSNHEALLGQSEQKRLVIGGVQGRRACAYTYPGINPLERSRVLDRVQFSDHFELMASAFAKGETICTAEMTRKGSLWSHLDQFAFTPHWLSPWLDILLDSGPFISGFPLAFLRCGSGNMSMLRSTFDLVGPFDPEMIVMEDWEFGLRAQIIQCDITLAGETEPLHLLHEREADRQSKVQKAKSIFFNKHDKILTRLLEYTGAEHVPGANIFFPEPIGGMPTSPRTQKPERGFCSLTFDDGPSANSTPEISRCLARAGISATFFLIGTLVEQHPSIVTDLVSDGHQIGIHGWSHIAWQELTPESLRVDLQTSIHLLTYLTGNRPKFVRPPYGKLPVWALSVLADLQLEAIGWSVQVYDWLSGTTTQDIISHLACSDLNDQVVLFHDGSSDPAVVIPAVHWLSRVLSEHPVLTPVRLDTFLRMTHRVAYSESLYVV